MLGVRGVRREHHLECGELGLDFTQRILNLNAVSIGQLRFKESYSVPNVLGTQGVRAIGLYLLGKHFEFNMQPVQEVVDFDERLSLSSQINPEFIDGNHHRREATIRSERTRIRISH